MGHISIEVKESIVKKALVRGSASIESIAKANNVGVSSLCKWLKRYYDDPDYFTKEKNPKGVTEQNRHEQFAHLINTAQLDETELGAYCRQHGLYSHQLQQWKDDFMKSNDLTKKANDKAALKALKTENAELKKELRRKEKALAEASALLILKKKADLIWGKDEED